MSFYRLNRLWNLWYNGNIVSGSNILLILFIIIIIIIHPVPNSKFDTIVALHKREVIQTFNSKNTESSGRAKYTSTIPGYLIAVNWTQHGCMPALYCELLVSMMSRVLFGGLRMNVIRGFLHSSPILKPLTKPLTKLLHRHRILSHYQTRYHSHNTATKCTYTYRNQSHYHSYNTATKCTYTHRNQSHNTATKCTYTHRNQSRMQHQYKVLLCKP